MWESVSVFLNLIITQRALVNQGLYSGPRGTGSLTKLHVQKERNTHSSVSNCN